MLSDGRTIWQLAQQGVFDPAGAARTLLQNRYDRTTLWSALALVTVLTVLTMTVVQTIAPSPPPPGLVMPAPLALSVVLGFVLVAMVFAIHFTGRMLGGQGGFGDTLLLITWLQFMALLLSVVQIVVAMVLPFLADAVVILGMGLSVFWFLHVINVMHGFENLWKALFTFVLAATGVSFGLALIIIIIGAFAWAGGGL